MARVHCPDCEMAVVVDPNGVCPEGHLIGNAGRRIDLAIGDHTPHPDEPQPWSAVIEAAEAIEPDPEPTGPRAIRPISVAGEDDEPDAEPENENLMRELHALSDLDDRTEQRAATGPAAAQPTPTDPEHAGSDEPDVYRAPITEAPADTPAQPPAAEPAPPRSDEDLDAIAELAALFDAPPAQPETSGSAPSPDEGTSPAEGAHGVDEERGDEHLASVSHLPYANNAQASGAPATPERDTTRASGEAFDWSHFTAKGKRRRFGR